LQTIPFPILVSYFRKTFVEERLLPFITKKLFLLGIIKILSAEYIPCLKKYLNSDQMDSKLLNFYLLINTENLLIIFMINDYKIIFIPK